MLLVGNSKLTKGELEVVIHVSSRIGIPSYNKSTPVGAISESRHIIASPLYPTYKRFLRPHRALLSIFPLHNRNLLIRQAVELIDHPIDQRVGILEAGEQGFEFSEAMSELALQRFLEISA